MRLTNVTCVLALLAGCGNEGTSTPPPPPSGDAFTGCAGTSDAHVNLTAFWQAFDTHYAFFDMRLPGDGWANAGRETCATIDVREAAGIPVTPSELFDLMIGMARLLDDGHVNLTADDIGRDEDAEVSVYPKDDATGDLETNVEETYIEEDEFTTAAEEEISWGTIGDIGYVSITAMEGYSPAADDEAGDEDDHGIEDAAAHTAMAAVMAALGDTSGMIIDVRANGGGWDTVALEIATWFAGPRTLAWSEQRRNGPGHEDFGPWEDTFVEAAQPDAYDGPVVLLTSGGTYSAAEVFVLAMRVRDHVTVMGEPTSGHFSDQMEGTLPNGWVYDLSHERYRAADGMIYETRGAPVDEAVTFDVAALATGRDVMLDAALAYLMR
jgi:carboxyl-terminal processing protease